MGKPNRHTKEELREWQQLPLSIKVSMTKARIREWVNTFGEDGVYVSFSGGKDSTVLLDIARSEYPNIEAVFVDVPTQYPELKEFATSFPNVKVLYPQVGYQQVVERYGFPFISKEAAECISGAKKYLTSILAEASLNERTNEQENTRTSMRSYVESASMKNPTGGGYDNKYRKLNGLGEYAKRTDAQQRRWKQSEVGANVGNVHTSKNDNADGEYP